MRLFLEQHILGLVARISEVVNDSREERSMIDKRLSVKALIEMVLLGQASVRIARPQVGTHLERVALVLNPTRFVPCFNLP